MTNVERFNNQSPGEEIANAVSHGVGALLALAGSAVLVAAAAGGGSAADVVSSAIYGASLILLFLASTLYHSLQGARAKKVFQVLDHCSIFLLILGSYAPICLSLMGGAAGWGLFCANALLALLGVVFNAISVKRWHRLSLLVYLLMGWSVLFVLRPLLQAVPPAGFLLLLAGGLFYSVGIFFYKASRPRYMHAVWHLFVLAGSVLHYFFMLFYVVLG